MDQQKYIEDIREIREMMSRSSRFISLSGYSGISAGIIALCGAYAAYERVFADSFFLGNTRFLLNGNAQSELLIIALVTLVAALASGIYFTTRETKRNNEKLWDMQTRRLLVNLAIPLVSGGLFCLIMFFKGFIGFIAPLTLIFYGLALVNASKYTLGEIRSLGILEVALGLVAAIFTGYGLLFWTIGFGILHIVYGIVMQMKRQS